MQIHMIIRGEFRTHARTVATEGEMIRIEHVIEIIGLIEDGLIVLLAMMRKMEKIMSVITMEIGIILIINGVFQ